MSQGQFLIHATIEGYGDAIKFVTQSIDATTGGVQWTTLKTTLGASRRERKSGG